MKRLLNTLYITTTPCHLAREGDTVIVYRDSEVKLQLPIHVLGSILCFGPVSFTPPFLALCAERHVSVAFHSMSGRFLARVEGPVSGNVLLRREQYRRADSLAPAVDIARNIVIAKVANCRTILLRAARETADSSIAGKLRDASNTLSRQLTDLASAQTVDKIRGYEGEAAHTYFAVFNHLITMQKESFVFNERNRRPPLDNVNALLSFVYVVLANDAASALEGVGLDPAVGYLHTDRPGRPGLALDLMEEFRSYIADRLVLSLINLKQVHPEGFIKTESGAILMDDETRKMVLVKYQKKKSEEIIHPYLKEKVAIGLLPHVQAMLLARHLRGDMDGYPPFIFR